MTSLRRLPYGLGIRSVLGGNSFSWSSYWATLVSATVENAAPTNVVLTFPSAKTSLVATDFTIAGFTINSVSWTGNVLTLILSTPVVYNDSLIITFNKTGGTHVVTNNVLPFQSTKITTTGTNFSAGNKVVTSSPFVSGTQWILKFTFKADISRGNFYFSSSVDESNNYIYVPLGGASLQLKIPGNTSRPTHACQFETGAWYDIYIKRDGLSVLMKIVPVGSLGTHAWGTPSNQPTVNSASVFDTIGYRNVTSYTEGIIYNVEIYNLAGVLQHEYTGLGEDWTDQVSSYDGTLTTSNAIAFYYYNPEYTIAGNAHISGGDYFIDTGVWTNTGLTNDGTNLVACLYTTVPAACKLQKYNPSTGAEVSSIILTGVLPVNALQGVAYKPDGTYLILINDSTDGNKVKMCNVSATGVLLSTVTLASATAAGAGSISYDASLNSGAGGVWYKGVSTEGIRTYKLDGTLIATITSVIGNGESLYFDNNHLYLVNSATPNMIMLVESDGWTNILTFDHPHYTIYGVHGEDEGMTKLGDWIYLCSDTLTHGDGVLNKNVIWKFRAVNVY